MPVGKKFDWTVIICQMRFTQICSVKNLMCQPLTALVKACILLNENKRHGKGCVFLPVINNTKACLSQEKSIADCLIIDIILFWLILCLQYIYFIEKLCYIRLSLWPCITIDNFLQDLLFSYNIAVDRSDEVKRTLGKSASSVGLQLPQIYQP